MRKLVLLILLPVFLSAQSVRTPLSKDNFTGWRTERGEWYETGAVFMNPDEPNRLTALPGSGMYVNGVTGRTNHLVTFQEWDDMRLHIEFMVPENSNSGVYFMGRYEIQIRDSYKKESYNPGNECGGIYQRWDESRDPKGFEGHSPDIHAARPPGQWQWFDAVFRAPRFDANGNKIANAHFERVFHNGYLIHENVELTGPTRASLYEDEQATGPIMLQGDHGPVAYRRMWAAPVDVNPFFAMDTGTRDEFHQSFEQQVEMLRALGYDGMDHTGVENLDEKLHELDWHGLRLFAVYLDVWADREKQWFNEGLGAAIQQLKGRDVVLWVPIRSNDFEASDTTGDEYAVNIVQDIADLAAQADVQVALYPHSFFLMETIDDALRIAQKANRPNVGVTFNLCHWLRTDNSDLESTLTEAAPYLKMVTINGADYEGEWDRLIQPLGRGEFDVSHVLNILNKIEYNGPIGLQGYGIGGDVAENLQQSMRAWSQMNHQQY